MLVGVVVGVVVEAEVEQDKEKAARRAVTNFEMFEVIEESETSTATPLA
jgi:hypothetical protein